MRHPWDQYLEGLVLTGAIRPYQLRWLREALASPRTAMLGARQIGKGWTVALLAITIAVGYVGPEGQRFPGHDVLVVSKDQRTSKNMLSMIRKHVSAAEKIYGKFTSPRLGGLSEVYVENGGKILSLPGTPKSIQGFTGSVIVDELAANRWDPEEMFAQAASVSSSQDHFRFVVVSNAGEAGGFAHKFFLGDGEWAERRAQFRVSSTTIYDAYGDVLPDRFVGLQKSISTSMWARFYLNEFSGSGIGVINVSSIPVLGMPAEVRGRISWHMAVDPGYGNNPTGVVVAGRDPRGGEIWIGYSDWWFTGTVEEQVERVKHVMRAWNVRSVVVDQGIGGFAWKPRLVDSRVKFIAVNGVVKQKQLTAMVDLVGAFRLALSMPSGIKGVTGHPDILLADLGQVICDEAGAMELARNHVRAGDSLALSRGASVGREIHADSAAALSYLAETLAGVRFRGA